MTEDCKHWCLLRLSSPNDGKYICDDCKETFGIAIRVVIQQTAIES